MPDSTPQLDRLPPRTLAHPWARVPLLLLAVPLLLIAAAPTVAQTPRQVEGIVAAAYDAELPIPLGESGVLAEVAVTEGDRVKAGQTLATLDRTRAALLLERAKLAVENDHALRLARQQIERLQGGAEDGGAAPEAIDALRVEVELQTLRQEQARIDFELAELRYGQHALTAPVDGVIDRVYVSPGQSLAPGQPVLRLVRRTPVTIEATIPSDVAAGLSVGHPVTIHPPHAPATMSFAFAGHISYLASTIDPQTDARFARITLDTPETPEASQAPENPESASDGTTAHPPAPTLLPGARVRITLHPQP